MGCLKLSYYNQENALGVNPIFLENALEQKSGKPEKRLSSYRYGFNGQEKVDEISGTGNHNTAMFWEYDTRLGRRWNQDPKPNPSISNYAAFANNPIWYSDALGDTIIVDNKGYTSRVDRDDDGNLVDNLVFTQGEDGLVSLGELTKDVDAEDWFTNLMQENSKEADDIWNPLTFRNNVKKGAKWDYKNRGDDHILGIAFSLDTDTKFSFGGETYRSEDLNNLHFGVVGKATGLFPETFMLKQAGAAEIGKWKDLGKEVPATWMPRGPVITVPDAHNPGMTHTYPGPLLAPYGDNPIDHEMIKKGFEYYNKNRSSLDGDWW